MKSNSLTALLCGAVLAALLAACGGGGDNGSAVGIATDAGPLTKLLPTVWTSEGRPFSNCLLSPACSGNPYAPFTAAGSVMPEDGAKLSGLVRLEVSGYDMANVELLPGSGYAPKMGVFNLTGDKTVGWMDLDTTRLPNGPISMRVSAFDRPAGRDGAREITAMSARTWIINNPVPPAQTFMAAVTAAPASSAVVSGVTRLTVQGSGLANVELLPVSGYAPRLGTFNISADRTQAWLDLDTRALSDGARDVRISAFNVTQGQADASEIVAMPARRWVWRNSPPSGSGTPFTANVTIAPVHGELIGQFVRLEVRGSGIRNVELLPATGYTPKLGTFNIQADGSFAWLLLDTRSLQNGPLEARISAFDAPAGQPGAREIIAMPVRQWNVKN